MQPIDPSLSFHLALGFELVHLVSNINIESRRVCLAALIVRSDIFHKFQVNLSAWLVLWTVFMLE